MYIPGSFKEDRGEILHDLIRKNNFGILITQNDGIPEATHLPFMIDPDYGEPRYADHLHGPGKQALEVME